MIDFTLEKVVEKEILERKRFTGDDKIIYDKSIAGFKQENTYMNLAPDNIKDILAHRYAMDRVERYNSHWKRYPVGHHLREDYDILLGLEPDENYR